MSPTNRLFYERFCELSGAAQNLVSLMRALQFGRIEGLCVRNGEPVFDPPPKVVKVARIGAAAGPTMGDAGDFTLKKEIVDLFHQLANLDNGTVDRLEFRWGLPCLLEFSPHAVPAVQPTPTPK